MKTRREKTIKIKKNVLDGKIIEEAELITLQTIFNLTKLHKDNSYYSPTAIAQDIPKNDGSYGRIVSSDIPSLLENYISDGIVDQVILRNSFKRGKNRIAYRANLDREAEAIFNGWLS